jgi:acetylornithine aminotransferase
VTHTEELAARWSAVMMSNYKTPPVALARGAGATVWTNDLTHAYVHENSAYSS